MTYDPKPIDIADIKLSDELQNLQELLAKNTHEVWAEARRKEGWIYGNERNDKLKQHPCLVPYNELPESEKEYDRILAMNTLKLIIKFGYEIKKLKNK